MHKSIFCTAAIAAFATIQCAADGRLFTVRDDVEMSEVVFPRHEGEAPLLYSPNGRYAVIVTEHSTLEKATPEDTIVLVDTQGEKPRASPLATLSGFKDGPIVSSLQWTVDSDGLVFALREKNGLVRVMELNLASHAVQALTPEDQNVTAFEVSDGDLVYSVTSPGSNPAEEHSEGGPMVSVAGRDLFDVLFPKDIGHSSLNYSDLWTVIAGQRRQVVDRATGAPVHVLAYSTSHGYAPPFSLSPDRKTLAIIQPVAGVPAAWLQYDAPTGLPYAELKTRFRPGPQDLSLPSWQRYVDSYQLLDLTSGRFTPLLDAPTGHLNDWNSGLFTARWAADGQSVLLSNSFLPLRPGQDGHGQLRENAPCVVAVRVRTAEAGCVIPLKAGLDKNRFALTDVRFDPRNDDTVIVEYDRSFHGGNIPNTERYERQASGEWKRVDGIEGVVAMNHAATLEVRQDLDHWPILRAVDPTDGSSSIVYDPNPQLAGVDLGQASSITWKDKLGNSWTAGLVLPPGYQTGRRYPLVIQTHGFDPHRFLSYGAFTSGFAARELAAYGMVVLQMPWNPDHFGARREGSDQILGFESAVTTLAGRGLVDPKRVGVIGFSRTVYHVMCALTSRPGLFAASSVIDGVNFGYFEYTLLINNGNASREYVHEADAVTGADPLGQGIQQWVRASPEFNLSKVRAPLLVVAPGKSNLLADWEPYAVLHALNKPVDAVLVPEGDHVESNPLQRMATQGVNVDWFRFWLQGYEDPDSAKAGQYRRWEHLCDLQKTSAPDRPSFCTPTKP